VSGFLNILPHLVAEHGRECAASATDTDAVNAAGQKVGAVWGAIHPGLDGALARRSTLHAIHCASRRARQTRSFRERRLARHGGWVAEEPVFDHVLRMAARGLAKLDIHGQRGGAVFHAATVRRLNRDRFLIVKLCQDAREAMQP